MVPEGWLIDQIARQRLMHRLEQAPDHITGVAAGTDALPPGASYRVCAEWRSLEPWSVAYEVPERSTNGPVLVRPGVKFAVRGDVVEVDSGSLLVDPGAHAHNPWQVADAIEVASEQGRSPFPRRPIVVFITGQPDAAVAEWARRLVNQMVRRDIEGRLAMPTVAEGLHLTRPCLPNEESIRALAPDVVVPLEPGMAERVDTWCGADRSVVFVEFDSALEAREPELVSWRLGQARGRIRGRIGPGVDVASLVGVVERLCAGPHPLPPSDRAVAVVPSMATTGGVVSWPRSGTQTMAVITGAVDLAASRRIDGLVDHLSASGVKVDVYPTGRRTPSATRAAGIVMLVGTAGWDLADDLIDARRTDGGATVVDLAPSDFEMTAETSNPSVSRRAADQARRCGLVTVPSRTLQRAARRLGVRMHVLPTVLKRERAAALRVARPGANAPSQLVVGWHLGSSLPPPAYLGAVAEALQKILADWPDVRVLAVADPSRLPSIVRGHDRVRVVADEPEPPEIAGWIAHLWTPSITQDGVLDDALSVLETSSVGVPTVLPAVGETAIEGYVAADVLVDDVDRPEAWTDRLRLLIDDQEKRLQLSTEVMRRSNSLYGNTGSKLAVDRFLGWALYRRSSS